MERERYHKRQENLHLNNPGFLTKKRKLIIKAVLCSIGLICVKITQSTLVS